MNVLVHNKRNLVFQIPDLDVQVDRYEEEDGIIYYMINVKLLAQIWTVKRRFSQFDALHKRLKSELDPRLVNNLPMLPPKRIFYNREKQFLEDRMRGLNDYLATLITIREAIEHPSLQRFLEIDTNYNPNYEYESIQPRKTQHTFAKPVIALPKLRVVSGREDLWAEDEKSFDLELEKGLSSIKAIGEDKYILEKDKPVKGSLQKKIAALSNRIALETQNENADLLRDEYENLDPENCTEIQRLVQRVSKISSFYVKENIELYDLSQRVSLMTSECQSIEAKYDNLDNKFREVAKKIEEYQKQQEGTEHAASIPE